MYFSNLLQVIPIIRDTVYVERKSFWNFDSSFWVSMAVVLVALVVAWMNNHSSNKKMKKDNLIKLRKEWIKEFSDLILKIYNLYCELVKYAIDREHSDTTVDWIKIETTIREIFVYQNELSLKVTIDGKSLNYVGPNVKTLFIQITDMNREFRKFFKAKYTSLKQYEDEMLELKKLLSEFKLDAEDRIIEQTKLLVK